MKHAWAAIVVAAVLAAGASLAYSLPKPSVASNAWELQIDLEDLQSIQVTMPGEKAPQTFWFLRYTLTNQTGEDQLFVPTFELYTDTGELIRAGQGVGPRVFNEIKGLYDDPLLKDQTGMTGKILQGEDNAKSGVAIFRNFDLSAGSVDVFVGSLSGDTQVIKLPVPIKTTEIVGGKETEVTIDSLTLTKTLKLEYNFGGDPARSGAREKMVLSAKSWLMR